ncbi:S9 family peptidase [Microbacterium sp. NPDC058342]|uniref:S9 family peptidase n=1 Tax=Microbacterium sp. NPDC058342 TaxID=3346454 RepID=UPI003656114C
MKRAPALDDLDLFELPSDPVLSPDGQRVVYSVRTVNTRTDEHEHALRMLDVSRNRSSALTDGTTDVSPRWSPDGELLAFLREVDGVPQIHILRMSDVGEPVAVTRLPHGAGTPVWSPDGGRIAFNAPVHPAGDSRDTASPIVVRTLGYKNDGSEMSMARSQVHVLDVATLECRALTEVEWNTRRVSWHPDGESLLTVGGGQPDADRLATSGVYRLDARAAEPAAPELLALKDGAALAAWWTRSSDGMIVVGREYPGAGPQYLLRVDGDGREVDNLTATFDRNLVLGSPGYPGAMPWEGDGDIIYFCARDGGATQLFSISQAGVVRHVRGSATEVIAGMSVAGDRVAIVCVTPTSPGVVLVVDVSTGEELARSTENAGIAAEIRLIEPQERAFTLRNGRTVHGWVTRHPSAPDRGPLLLDIHGGPHNAWNGAFDQSHYYQQVLAARGWTILTVNPVGSDGYGEAFFNGNVGAWGHGDEADFLEPIDALVAEGIVDPQRLAVAGYSYGGYSTCWLTSHTDRFAAAIAGGLICDTMGVTSSDEGGPEILCELDATPWGDQETLKAQSPYLSVGAVTTPTLILHGEADKRCPMDQAERWFVSLRTQGVATEMVVYPGASHLFVVTGRPSHRVDYGRRLVAWLDEFVSL